MFKFYEVGGKVRDEILGLTSKDIDYVAVSDGSVQVKIDELFEHLFVYLERMGFQIFLTTKAAFTIRAKFPKDHPNAGITADFVLARKELGYKEGTRQPIVVPGNLYDDMSRRDFTVNAIARDEEGELIDYFNGMEDLHNKILRTPIRGDITFSDDPLRLIRAVRFAITKDLVISDEIHQYLRDFDYQGKFHVVSEERIREELYKCFKHDTLKTLRYLDRYEALKQYIFLNTKLWLKPTNEE
jgi:poly(A) polymerase